MRSTDDPWPQPMKPLGEKVTPSKPEPQEWWPVPDAPGVFRNAEGKYRTNDPKNEKARYGIYGIWGTKP